MKVILRDGSVTSTDIDAQTLYAICKAVENGQADCYIKVAYRKGSVFIAAVFVNIKRTFGDYILDSYRDTDPPLE